MATPFHARAHAAVTTAAQRTAEADGIADLCTAIVHRACLDYLLSFRGVAEYPCRCPVGTTESIERFFRSDWFALLCDADGESLIQAMQAMAARGQVAIPYLTKVST